MVPPLAALSLAVAAGLALFASALALPRPAHPPARGPLLALLILLTALVLRGAGLRMDLWAPGPVELAMALGAFVAIPVLLVLVVRAAVRAESGGGAAGWRLLALPLAVTLGLATRMLVRGEARLETWEWQAFVLGLHAVSLGCAALIVRLRRSPHRPAWLDAVLLLFAIHWLFSSASWTVGVFGLGSDGLATAFEVGSMVSLLAFGAVTVVRALGALPALQPPAAAPYTRSGLDAALCRQRAEALNELMRTTQPYLDPELSAATLADVLNVTPRELSQVLNVEIGQGFFEFVNAYRVEEAKRQLVSPDRADATILEILYSSGFNSKSAFHRAFKANVGMTPSAFRRLRVDPYEAKAA